MASRFVFFRNAARVGRKRCAVTYIPDEWSSSGAACAMDRTRLTGRLVSVTFPHMFLSRFELPRPGLACINSGNRLIGEALISV